MVPGTGVAAEEEAWLQQVLVAASSKDMGLTPNRGIAACIVSQIYANDPLKAFGTADTQFMPFL